MSDRESALRALPPRFCEALGWHYGPVRPILPPAARTLAVTFVGAAVCIAAVAMRGMSPDAPELGLTRLWAPAALRLAAGVWLIHIAMRSAQPASGLPRRVRIAGSLLAPLGLTALVGWISPPAVTVGSHPSLRAGLNCYLLEAAIALPAAVLLGWMLARAYAVRPVFAAAAGAAGAGLIADAAMHLICPIREWTHTLLVHGAAVGTLSLAGVLLGFAVLRVRFRGTTDRRNARRPG